MNKEKIIKEDEAKLFQERCTSESWIPRNDEEKKISEERQRKADKLFLEELKKQGYKI